MPTLSRKSPEVRAPLAGDLGEVQRTGGRRSLIREDPANASPSQRTGAGTAAGRCLAEYLETRQGGAAEFHWTGVLPGRTTALPLLVVI